MTWRRQQQLLATAIAHHLETGRPVGSASLAESVEGRWSSATIRNELAVLEEMGYLKRIHASSGRVPTDRGFRFLVDRLLARDRPMTATAQGLGGRIAAMPLETPGMRAAYAAEQASAYLGFPIIIGGELGGQWQFVRGGVTRVLAFSEFESLDLIRRVTAEIESGTALETVLKDLATHRDPTVRIGSEIAVPALDRCSIVVAGFPKTGAGVIAGIGPRRMPYLHVIAGLAQWAAWIEKIWQEPS